MDYLTHTLFDESKAKRIVEKLRINKTYWQEGKETAGSHAAKVKKNLQLKRESAVAIELSEHIVDLITKDQLLKSFCLPRRVHGVMFSSASAGDGYGAHVDNAYMNSGRSDLSFTIFLSDPNQYQGGELCIQTIQGDQRIKLNAGEIVVYPSTSLHSVKTVLEGERLVCVGWIQSYVANNEDRNMLFGLDAGARGLLAKYGQCNELDLIFQSYNNFLRRLGD